MMKISECRRKSHCESMVMCGWKIQTQTETETSFRLPRWLNEIYFNFI